MWPQVLAPCARGCGWYHVHAWCRNCGGCCTGIHLCTQYVFLSDDERQQFADGAFEGLIGHVDDAELVAHMLLH